VHTVTGPDTNVSQLVWGMNPVGPVFYVTGAPGTAGNLGILNTSTYVTTNLFSNLPYAQDAVFDPYTGLIILFGGQEIDTFNPITQTLGTPTPLPGGACGVNTFTAGAVDGAGNALIVGCGEMEYVSFSSTGSVLSVQQVASPTGAKDVALVDAPAPTPEPSTAAFILIGLAFTAVRRIRRRSA